MDLYARVHEFCIWPMMEWRDRLRTGPVLKILKASEGWSLEQLQAYQLERLKLLLQHAYDNTVFYRKRFAQIGFEPGDFKTLDDFRDIPPIAREDLNEFLEEMTARNIPETARHYASTGGSTGLATRFVRDNACLSIKKASEYRFNTWMGWRPGDRTLYYWVALADFATGDTRRSLWKPLLFTRSLGLFAGKLNERILHEHVHAFKRFEPILVRAFPSALQRFAEYVADKGLSLPAPKGIISVGEPLLESQRRLFHEVFQCDVFNCYVSRECGNIGCECSAHEGIHVAEELVYLEIEAPQKSEYGEILATDLWNFGMPLIRYKIQDAARWVPSRCSCGREHRRVGLDAARLSDFLISPLDGSYVSGSALTHYLLAEGPKVGRIKLIQIARDQVLILIAGDPQLSKEVVEHIRHTLAIVFKGVMKVEFEFRESIPLLPSGKYSFVERKF
ncbi:MAG: Phenylacetate-coenzyme A ligase [Syntrophorhabdus sp. PtaU1.Bin002]|nr:MAG: Phenylacetate-coenzyme A ligase [Syntrophorhabdus sp. PtaU1.Bin002]